MILMRSGDGQWLAVNNTGLQGSRKALYILLRYNNISRHYTFAVDAHVLLSPKGRIIYGMANENEAKWISLRISSYDNLVLLKNRHFIN